MLSFEDAILYFNYILRLNRLLQWCLFLMNDQDRYEYSASNLTVIGIIQKKPLTAAKNLTILTLSIYH